MWAKIPDQLTDNPAFLALGADIAAGVWLYVAALCHCARHLTDGHIHAAIVPRLIYCEGVDNATLADKLVSAGLWERAEDGYRVVDYLMWNPSADAYRSWSAAGKKGALARWEKRNKPKAPSCESHNEPQSESGCSTSPVPSSLSVTDSEVVSTDATALDCLNAILTHFPGANRSEIAGLIANAEDGFGGMGAVREAVSRTLTRARSKNPARYLQQALTSVRRGE